MKIMRFHIALALLLTLFACKEQPIVVKDKMPNLLIVLSDQHSYDMLGSSGNQQVLTPNLDSFASDGLRLTNAYSNQPLCTPYRGMIMSGLHPLKNGAFVNDTPLLPNKSKLLAQILKDKGYQTAYIGKWHLLGGERDRPIPIGELRYGFDTVLTNNCHVDFRPGHAFFWNDKGEKTYFEEWEVYGQTKQTLNYLEHIDKEKPFALVVSWHPPLDWGKFEGEDGQMHYRYDTLDKLMSLYHRDSIQLRPGLEPTPDRKRMYHGHMAMVRGVDKAFGLLMDKLEEIGLKGNTLTVFSADHGDMLESHNATLPKQYPHDYSNHIPFLINYPGKIKKETVSNDLFGALDIMPTILGFMNIQTDQTYDGKDLSKALVSDSINSQDYLPLWVYQLGNTKNHNWRGVMIENYTFNMGKDADSLEIVNVLYDRKKDPNQLNNLFNDADYTEAKKEMIALTYAGMAKFNDKFYEKDDFLNALSKEKWMYNYTKTPLELLEQ